MKAHPYRHVENQKALSGSAEYNLHKLFVIYLNPSVSVGVDSLESLRQRLDHDTGPHKTVKSDPGGWAITRCCRTRGWSIFLFDQGQQIRAEFVSKTVEGRRQLVPFDGTGTILVEVSEYPLPVFDVSPKSLELIETNRPTAVCVEDGHEHLHCIKIKSRPISVNQSRLELSDCDGSRPIRIHRRKGIPKLRICAMRWSSLGGRRSGVSRVPPTSLSRRGVIAISTVARVVGRSGSLSVVWLCLTLGVSMVHLERRG